MVVVDSVTRLLPGVLGDEDSAQQDSFMGGLLDCPHYTRPEDYEGRKVPPVLLGGHHGEIAKWRRQQSLIRTFQKRPDLLQQVELNEEDQRLLEAGLHEQD
jgi:tRNA (guanine37-N1)-methyltransferase